MTGRGLEAVRTTAFTGITPCSQASESADQIGGFDQFCAATVSTSDRMTRAAKASAMVRSCPERANHNAPSLDMGIPSQNDNNGSSWRA